MDLGSIEYNDGENYRLKTTALVLAFQAVAEKIVDKKGGAFKEEQSHYEASAKQTTIIVGGNVYIGQYGGDVTKKITVPFGYDEVKQLLADGAKKGVPVDFTDENIPTLRASLKKDRSGLKLNP